MHMNLIETCVIIQQQGTSVGGGPRKRSKKNMELIHYKDEKRLCQLGLA
jgi:hypothetical protein